MRTTNLAMKPIDCHSATGPNSITVPPISRPEGLLQGKGHGHSQVNGDGSAVEYCGLVLPPSKRGHRCLGNPHRQTSEHSSLGHVPLLVDDGLDDHHALHTRLAGALGG